MGFKIHIKKGSQTDQLPSVLTWDMPGVGSEIQVTRHATREYLQAMLWCHKTIASINSGDTVVDVPIAQRPQFVSMLLTEVCANIARMFAVEKVRAAEVRAVCDCVCVCVCVCVYASSCAQLKLQHAG
jgi:hypothetical protein